MVLSKWPTVLVTWSWLRETTQLQGGLMNIHLYTAFPWWTTLTTLPLQIITAIMADSRVVCMPPSFGLNSLRNMVLVTIGILQDIRWGRPWEWHRPTRTPLDTVFTIRIRKTRPLQKVPFSPVCTQGPGVALVLDAPLLISSLMCQEVPLTTVITGGIQLTDGMDLAKPPFGLNKKTRNTSYIRHLSPVIATE